MARKKKSEFDAPVLVIKLQKGLAERKMLPLDHVIRVLEEVRQMVFDAGREIQRDTGIDNPDIEFGLELLAGNHGLLFKAGSVEAHVAITANTQTGVLAAHKIVDTIESLAHKKYTPATEGDRSIVRRLNRVAKIQQTDKMEMQLGISEPGKVKHAKEAVFGETAAATAWAIQAPVFQMGSMVLYGKLYELKDASGKEEGAGGFWGELRRDNGELWRIQFKDDDAQKAAAQFRNQVTVTGTAKYYRIASPKLVADDIAPDKDRDYESAFDDLLGCDKDIYPDGFQRALHDLREDD